ncbi:MAG: hypothetical protein U0271_00570 [Polyangiaceae bacterium]
MARALSVFVHTHGHCFDGLASAALFQRLIQLEEPDARLDVTFRSCGYSPKFRAVPTRWLSGDRNAILDFRYTESARLTHYFDHHATAFDSEDERHAAELAAGRDRRRALHFDPTCSSCAKLIDRVARERGTPLDSDELVRWADCVDAARFDSPETAFFAKEPALVLADVVERHGDTPFIQRVAPLLASRPLDEVAADPNIVALAKPLGDAKRVFLDAIRQHGRMADGIVVIDLADASLTPAGKFASYVAFPTCRYAVVLLRTHNQLKLGVSHNPWSGLAREHDIAALCRAEGGGGHPMVGAVNFSHDSLVEARAALRRVTGALQRPPPSSA